MDTPHENRSFCSSCGAPLTGGAFCGKCGAKIIASTVTTSAVEPAPAAAPVVESAPAASLATASCNWKFPLIPVILMGLVFVVYLIPLFAQIGELASGSLSFSFVLSFLEVGCLALLAAGMIVCKKERNLIVGFGCLGMCVLRLAYAVYFLYFFAINNFDILSILRIPLFYGLDFLCFTLIGVVYLVAAPKLSGLKIVACLIPIGIGLIEQFISLFVTLGSGAATSFANFLCYTVTLYAAFLLYTPFKKK